MIYEELLGDVHEIRKAIESLDHDEGIRSEILFDSRRAILFVTRSVVRGYSVAVYAYDGSKLGELLYFKNYPDSLSALDFVLKNVNGKAYRY